MNLVSHELIMNCIVAMLVSQPRHLQIPVPFPQVYPQILRLVSLSLVLDLTVDVTAWSRNSFRETPRRHCLTTSTYHHFREES